MSDRGGREYQGNSSNRGGSVRDLYQWDGSGGGGQGQGQGRDLYQWDGSGGGGQGQGQGQGRDLYQWDGGDTRQPARPQRNDGGANQRMRDEAYQPPARQHRPCRADYTPQCGTRPQEVRTHGRNGDNVMIVYGNVYINMGGNDNGGGCRRRNDGRDEYYGRGYDYSQYYRQQYEQYQQYQYQQYQRYQYQQYQQYYNSQYRQPQCEPCQPYYEYGYRQYQPQQNYYSGQGGASFQFEGSVGFQGQARFRARGR